MSTRPSAAVQLLVRARAHDLCEVCGGPAEGGSYHHRRVKGMGGDKRADTNLAANIMLLCGSGTTGCHGWVHHDHTGQARERGWLLSKFSTPSSEAMLTALHGPIVPDDAGGWVEVP